MSAHQVVVVDPRFCFPQQTSLIMQEQLGMLRNDNFTITDTAGRPFFLLAAAPSLSMSQPKQLLDVYNNPVLLMERKMPSMRGTWLLKRASDKVQVASVRPSMGMSPTIKVFLNDGDDDADFIVQGDFRAKKFDIVHVKHGRGQRVIASVKKEGRFSNTTAFLKSMVIPEAQKYQVTIEPDVDAAFAIALAVLCDEMFHDQPR